jgi:hypothetical protein
VQTFAPKSKSIHAGFGCQKFRGKIFQISRPESPTERQVCEAAAAAARAQAAAAAAARMHLDKKWITFSETTFPLPPLSHLIVFPSPVYII